MTIGFDGRVVNEMLGETLEKTLPERFLSYRSDLIGEIWSDRPALSAEPVWILDSKYTGESAADRLAKVREKMKENGAEVHILTALDDIAWMLNIRGNDIPCNPVVLSYLILTETEGHLFIQEATLNDEVKQYLAGLGISIHPYDAVYDFAAGITNNSQSEQIVESEKGQWISVKNIRHFLHMNTSGSREKTFWDLYIFPVKIWEAGKRAVRIIHPQKL